MSGKTRKTRSLEAFADRFRLKIRLDDCGDPIIPGRRGHLYFADRQLCLMVLDGPVVLPRRWQALGGDCWLGSVSKNARGRRVQDVWIRDIPEEHWKEAIRLAGCKTKRIMSPAQAAHLAEARKKLPQRPSSAEKTTIARAAGI